VTIEPPVSTRNSHTCYSSREMKGGLTVGVEQWQSSELRLAPQLGQSPWQSGLQIIFMGTDRITCSVKTSANSTPSPE